MTDLAATHGLIDDWRACLDDDPPGWQIDELRQSTRTGRPLGSPNFINKLEAKLGRRLRPLKRVQHLPQRQRGRRSIASRGPVCGHPR